VLGPGRDACHTRAVHSSFLLWIPAIVSSLLLGATGCSFEGYVPQDDLRRDLAESERNIGDLSLDQSTRASLDCSAGHCRMRFRVITPGPGTLTVSADGPLGEGAGSGPRLARIALEGTTQQVLGMRTASQGAPFEVTHNVDPGLHYIFVQALSGRVEFQVSNHFTPSDPEAATGDPGVLPGFTPPPPMGEPRDDRLASVAGSNQVGADFSADPRRDLSKLKRYAFAEDPAERLEPGAESSPHSDPFVEKQIQREVRYFLADISVYQVAAEEADFLVSIQVGARTSTWFTVNNRLYSHGYDATMAQWSNMGGVVNTHQYFDGMLIIDLIDPESGDLIWHGWTTEPMTLSDDRDAVIKRAVKSVLSQF
jgi:hypothetical protein